MATLDVSDLSHLTNDPIQHEPQLPQIPVKFPFNIPNFDGKSGEDPKNCVMTYHFLLFLQRSHGHFYPFETFTKFSTKWYIELPQHSFQDFNMLEMSFFDTFLLIDQIRNRYKYFYIASPDHFHTYIRSYPEVEMATQVN